MTSQQLGRESGATIAANDTASRWKVLLAHDGALTTCDALFDVIREAMDGVEVLDAPSAEAARSILRHTAVDVCFVCLDLPPSPQGGIKLAQELVRVGLPLVLVTRSLRWLPNSAAELRVVPWVRPEATAADVVRAIDEAVTELDAGNQITHDSSFDEEEDTIPQRISEV